MNLAIIILSLVTLERLGELWFARRNTHALIEKGAFEVAKGHYPLIVALHAVWLAGLWLLAHDNGVNLYWLVAFFILQILRFWTLTTLGSRWTTRIIIVPNSRLVNSGPYKYISHPNYLVVIGEIAVLPLCLNMPIYALIFTIANALILSIRIREENRALQKLRTFQNL